MDWYDEWYWKKKFWWIFGGIILISTIFIISILQEQPFQKYDLDPSSDDFKNPERGFYEYVVLKETITNNYIRLSS
ncbi:MAG: hypothetical protein Q8O92_01815 [Candidatus Latescibacter sp.]|nr:hypothetical protein [Candidatus Latescibacter sp.]